MACIILLCRNFLALTTTMVVVVMVVAPVPMVHAWTTSTTTTTSWSCRSRRSPTTNERCSNTPQLFGFGRRNSVLLLQPLLYLAAVPVPVSKAGEETASSSPSPSVNSNKKENSNTKTIYSMPALYDLAFGYRDFEEEVDFLLNRHAELNTAADSSDGQQQPPVPPVRRILEVAAGPARHSIAALQKLHPLLNNGGGGDSSSSVDNEESSSVCSVHCIDSSPEMAAYARQVASDALSGRGSESAAAATTTISVQQQQQLLDTCFHYQVADMRSFTLASADAAAAGAKGENGSAAAVAVEAAVEATTTMDTAWILLGSLQHLTTNADVIQCLQCVHAALDDTHGTLFIELPHPRETFSMVECTRNGWKVPLRTGPAAAGPSLASSSFDDDDDYDDDDYDDDEYNDDDDDEEESSGGQLSIVWGDTGDAFDPVTQVRQFTIRMELTGVEQATTIAAADDDDDDDDVMQSVQQVVPLRLFTAQEIDALARCAGFKVVAMYGALEEGVSVDDEDASFRLVCALRKQ